MGEPMENKEMKAWTVIINNSVERKGNDVWNVKSSDGTKQYTVIRWSDDLKCDCLGFRHYKNCKHTNAVRKMLEIARHNG